MRIDFVFKLLAGKDKGKTCLVVEKDLNSTTQVKVGDNLKCSNGFNYKVIDYEKFTSGFMGTPSKQFGCVIKSIDESDIYPTEGDEITIENNSK